MPGWRDTAGTTAIGETIYISEKNQSSPKNYFELKSTRKTSGLIPSQVTSQGRN